MSLLSPKEILLLDHILRKSSVSQRELAKETSISLGLINVILKKLIKDGYIQISQRNGRKVEYLLTSRGTMAAAKRTYSDTLNTIKDYRTIEVSLSDLLKALHKSGYDYFSIHGDGELKDLVESTLQKCLEDAPVTLGREHHKDPRAVVLNLTLDTLESSLKGDVVNVLEDMTKKVKRSA